MLATKQLITLLSASLSECAESVRVSCCMRLLQPVLQAKQSKSDMFDYDSCCIFGNLYLHTWAADWQCTKDLPRIIYLTIHHTFFNGIYTIYHMCYIRHHIVIHHVVCSMIAE